MQEIKKINILSVFKMSLLFGALLGIITGVYMYFALPAIIAANPALVEAQIELTGTITLQSVLIASVVQLVLMVIISVLVALLYNIFAMWIGGIRVECTDSGVHPHRK